MKISFKWLKQYVSLADSVSAVEVAEKLKASTVEVEKIITQGDGFENIVLAQVKKIEKHEGADKLNVCSVFDGKENFQVVCGGSNVVEGMKVAFAKVGAKVRWHGEGDLIELSPAKIRGVESFGMICAAEEIGLAEMYPSKSEKEILDLSQVDCKLGVTVAEALELDDVIFDIDNKSLSNRPDLWGHYGIAREVAVLFNKKIKEYKTIDIKNNKKVEKKLKVDILDNDLCSRYTSVVLDNICIKESPDWLKKSLSRVGINSINNIVDIVNFVMMDLGQPMHAFDSASLSAEKNGSKSGETQIVVRLAKDNEKFVALDGSEHELSSEMLVIADSEKVIALAGIMGGQNSQITDSTNSIILESANFNASNIRKTSTKLALRSDSSSRFEKSLDPNMTDIAIKKAVELILQVCPDAKISSNFVDDKHFHLNQGPVEISLDFIKNKLGIDVDKKNVLAILENLGFDVTEKKENLLVKIPSWRATKDISIKEDIVEEVARIYGYHNIVTQMPLFEINVPEKNKMRLLERRIQKILSQICAYQEAYSYSFVSPNILEKMSLDKNEYLELDNPIAKDRPYLRRNLLPNLLEILEKNIHKFDEVSLFEIGKVFYGEESGVRMQENSNELLPKQNTILTVVYSAKNDKNPFFELSSIWQVLSSEFSIDYSFHESPNDVENYFHPARSANIFVGEMCIGKIAELHPAVQKNIGIDSRVAVLEIVLDDLLNLVKEKNNYKPLSQFPSVLRDVALLVDKKVTNLELLNTIQSVSDLITEVELFDVFESDKIGKDKKSMAYHITYGSNEKTLETEEVEKVHEKVLDKLKKKFGAEVR